MEVGALIVAIYAAIAGTLAIGWEIYKWRREQRLDVVVEADELQTRQGTEVVGRFFVAQVHNRSAFPVRVTGATFIGHEQRGRRRYFTGEQVALPRQVAPHDAEEIQIPLEDVRDDLGDGFVVACVLLSTGKELISHPLSPSYRGPRPSAQGE